MANEENLKPWKKGESGNPNGRPKGSRNRSTVAKEMLDIIIKDVDPLKVFTKDDFKQFMEEHGMDMEKLQMIEANAEEFITLAMIAKAKNGDVNAYKALLDSAYGTPKQTIDIKDNQKPPPKIQFTNSDEEE